MKLELNRTEMEQAVRCFINSKGIDLSNQKVKCTFGREIVTVEFNANDVESESVVTEEAVEVEDAYCDDTEEYPFN